MTSVVEQERQFVAALEEALPADRPAEISLVYYDEVSWHALRAADEISLEDHTRSMDRIARKAAELGIGVDTVILDIDDYRHWLGNRNDSPDRRAQFTAGVRHGRQRYRLGMLIDTNLIAWATVAEDNQGRVTGKAPPRQNHVTGKEVLERLRLGGESQRDLADRLGIRVRTLQRIHSGKELPPLSLVMKALGSIH